MRTLQINVLKVGVRKISLEGASQATQSRLDEKVPAAHWTTNIFRQTSFGSIVGPRQVKIIIILNVSQTPSYMKGNITTLYKAKIIKNIFFQKNLRSAHVFNLHVSYPMDSHQQEALTVSKLQNLKLDMFEIYFNVCGLFLFSYVTFPRFAKRSTSCPLTPSLPCCP